MSNIKEAINRLKKMEKFCIECYQPEWMLADAVVSELVNFDTSEYNIFDIFSTEVIEKYILTPGAESILAGIVGGKIESILKTNSSATQKVDHSDLIPLYQRVFSDWELEGWITIKKPEDGKSPVSIKINE